MDRTQVLSSVLQNILMEIEIDPENVWKTDVEKPGNYPKYLYFPIFIKLTL